ncbi:MAG TPA: GNAT family N-acetyltransferase [Candidatus Baltobacteraceae bacterium]|jgi:ribosomal-protein-alanine N-acetyltransferase|nr:GNAT family N-acetyltransferase [Candidatus Baltobacteraceae bacterium]
MNEIVLETPRLILRRWRPDDVEEAAKIFAKPEVMDGNIPGGTWTAERTARIVERMRELDNEMGFGFYPIILRETGAIIGHCGLGPLEKSGEIEVAYILDSPHWKKGYASEAARAVVQRGFQDAGLDRIVAVAFPHNERSFGVMRRIGMTLVGPASHFGSTVIKYESLKS